MKKITILVAAVLAMASCGNQPKTADTATEDTAAKKMLQGIWVNEDGEDVAFKAKGDTIYYPDDTSLPVYFQIIDDTLVLHGAKVAKYHIQKQAPHLFVFENQSGDPVRLVKSEDTADNYQFGSRKAVPLNQRQLIKRDSIVSHADVRYHYYVQVNPTTYKVVKTSYNEDGVAVDNIYYDNIVHLSIYQGATCLYSSDFRKGDFAHLVPSQYLAQSILSDITLYRTTDSGLEFIASLAMPDASSSFQVKISISYKGKKRMAVFK